MDAYETMLAYKRWANARLLEDLEVIPAAALRRPGPLPFDDVLTTLGHLRLIDGVWRAHLRGEAHGETSRRPASVPPFEHLAAGIRELDDWFVDYARALPAAARHEVVHFDFLDGGAGRMTRTTILLHVANHATYHRGHISAALRALGHGHRSTDLPIFLNDRDDGP